MGASKFEELLLLVAPSIQKEDTLMRDSISAQIKLQILMRFLATGDCSGT